MVAAFNNIVILTGAGLSAESGLGTFRGPGGLWENFRIEDVATPEAFARDPVRVHDFYNLPVAGTKLQSLMPHIWRWRGLSGSMAMC